ncbi:MAG TPA: glycosyltransferase family 4 protein [Acidimicrobiia bacterium]|nr:glycosyltransferase family 4 protein [Acidimicrobiia bacterium]
MRIAQIAPAWYPVPPPGYGGIELMVGLLADGLVAAGHDVTLFASGGSSTKAELVSPMSPAPDPAQLGNPWFDGYHAVTAYQHAHEFDLVHDHAAIVGPACGAMLRGNPPVVHTLHGPWTDETRLFYSAVGDIVHLVAISESQRRDNPNIRYAATVHNGIDMDAYPLCEEKDDYLVYIGRANPDKGPSIAINVARRVGLPLKMILKRNEPAERAYFEDAIAPLVTDQVELHENVSHDEKVELLGRARAMIFPIRWPEPFGLVMVEAMACGTPVVTTNWGAAPELVEDGVTGYRRDDYADLVSAITLVDQLSPAACRARVASEFSAGAMVAKYEAVYTDLLGR